MANLLVGWGLVYGMLMKSPYAGERGETNNIKPTTENMKHDAKKNIREKK